MNQAHGIFAPGGYARRVAKVRMAIWAAMAATVAGRPPATASVTSTTTLRNAAAATRMRNVKRTAAGVERLALGGSTRSSVAWPANPAVTAAEGGGMEGTTSALIEGSSKRERRPR